MYMRSISKIFQIFFQAILFYSPIKLYDLKLTALLQYVNALLEYLNLFNHFMFALFPEIFALPYL